MKKYDDLRDALNILLEFNFGNTEHQKFIRSILETLSIKDLNEKIDDDEFEISLNAKKFCKTLGITFSDNLEARIKLGKFDHIYASIGNEFWAVTQLVHIGEGKLVYHCPYLIKILKKLRDKEITELKPMYIRSPIEYHEYLLKSIDNYCEYVRGIKDDSKN